jgi:hypothetical protein
MYEDHSFSLKEILDMGSFVDWEVADLDMDGWGYLVEIGYYEHDYEFQSVYWMPNAVYKKNLLSTWKRSELVRMCAPDDEQSSMP